MTTTISITELIAMRNMVDKLIESSGTSSGSTKIEKTKRKSGPSAYNAFTKKVTTEHKADMDAYKEAHPGEKGITMTFVGLYKKAHEDEYKEFEAAWKLKKSETPSDDADEASDEASEKASEKASVKSDKPKRVISDEQKAKMKAGREAAKAKKDAEKASGEPAEAKPKKTGKKAKKAENEVIKTEVVKPEAKAEAKAEAEDSEIELLPFLLSGMTYLRPGSRDASGTIEWATPDLWLNKKGVKGGYVGAIKEDNTIDEDAVEPELD